MSILQTTELKKYYGTKPNITKALDGVNLSVEQGEFVAIVGTSGSGKSTLLNMIGGLDVPTSGKVIVDGRDLSTLKDEQLTIFRRRKIGFIFRYIVEVLFAFGRHFLSKFGLRFRPGSHLSRRIQLFCWR